MHFIRECGEETLEISTFTGVFHESENNHSTPASAFWQVKFIQ
jgi:hypothetical protein